MILLTFSLSDGNPCCIDGGEGLDSGLGVTGGLGVLLAASGAGGDPQHTSRALRARLPPSLCLLSSARAVSRENGTCGKGPLSHSLHICQFVMFGRNAHDINRAGTMRNAVPTLLLTLLMLERPKCINTLFRGKAESRKAGIF